MPHLRLTATYLLIVAVSSAALAAPSLAQDAPMFRGNLAHTGVFDGAGPQTLTVRWTFPTSSYVISSPVIVGQTLFIGATNGRLYALDKMSGTQKWVFETNGRIASTPAVAKGIVYVLSYDDTLYAVDADSGHAKWKFGTKGERQFSAFGIHGSAPAHQMMPDPFDTYLSSPAVYNGLVIFGSSDSHVYALDARTGALRWKFKTGEVVHSSPAVVDGVVYIGGWDTYFYALTAASGALKWKFKTGDDPERHNQVGIPGSPAVVDGVVYFGCRDSRVYAVDAKTGKQRWARANGGSWVTSSVAVANGKVYYATADRQSFNELSAATGDSLWATRGGWYFYSSPAIAGPMAYIGNWDGRLYAFDLVSHEQISVFETDSARANRSRYFRPDGRPYFRAFRPRKEDFYDLAVVGVSNMWTMGSFVSSPVVSDGLLFIGSMDGNVYAFGDAVRR